MHTNYPLEVEDFRPRVIVWQLAQPDTGNKDDYAPRTLENGLAVHEVKSTLESIARMAKPIIVFTGSKLLQQEETFLLVDHGHSLGLKMIVETPPEEITQDIIRKYSIFGPRVFRVLVDQCILEDMDTRFKRTTEYYALERCLRMLKSASYEIHLGVTVQKPDIRALAFEHDYAFRKSARGIYCHLNLDRSKIAVNKKGNYSEEQIEDFIEAIAKIKRYSPDSMYFSPQCVQYGFVGFSESSFSSERSGEKEKSFEWKHLCLGGKRFAYITFNGKVQICSGLNAEAGDLRITGFDFQEIWESSRMFRSQRENGKTCTETREMINKEYTSGDAEECQPNVEYLP